MKVVRSLGGKAWWDFYCDHCGIEMKQRWSLPSTKLTHPTEKGFFKKERINCPFAGKVVTVKPLVEEME